MEDEFKNLIMNNNEIHFKEWINNNGKKPKPVSPIFYLTDLPEEERKKIEEEYK